MAPNNLRFVGGQEALSASPGSLPDQFGPELWPRRPGPPGCGSLHRFHFCGESALCRSLPPREQLVGREVGGFGSPAGQLDDDEHGREPISMSKIIDSGVGYGLPGDLMYVLWQSEHDWLP
jgi:hypothetical protein